MTMFPGKRIAIVHDWLNGMRGGERVLEHFCALFPHADLFTLLYEPRKVSEEIQSMHVIESPFGRLPGARRHYRNLLPLMPAFINNLPTANYDLVLSTSHCVAKAAPAPKRGVHLSYVFSPMRYAWDHFEDYLSTNALKNMALRVMRPWLQKWDRDTAQRTDAIAADSRHIADKIQRFWGREAVTIHPPVNLDRFQPSGLPPEDYFLVVAAMVPYKRIDRAIEAATIARQKLLVVGSGPEEERLRGMNSKYVEFLGRVSDDELPALYQGARALLYPATEDFGITAIEAQACGRPVLAFGSGGATETVIDGVTGKFFHKPTAKALAKLLRDHDDHAYDATVIHKHATTFSPDHFRSALSHWISAETRFVL